MTRWNRTDRIAVAFLVDVDGTLAGTYRDGRRALRPGAAAALADLACAGPVFLWSIAGADNGARLLAEFPALAAHVSGCFAKDDFPLHRVGTSYAIDDEGIDDAVLRCTHHLVIDAFDGTTDSGLLAEAVARILEHVRG